MYIYTLRMKWEPPKLFAVSGVFLCMEFANPQTFEKNVEPEFA